MSLKWKEFNMSRMSNIDYTIREYFSKVIIFFVIIVLSLLIYAEGYREEKNKADKINNIEKTLQNHTHYIDKLEADVDNLKEVQSR